MSTVSINIRLDSNVKKQAQELFSALGMDMTTAINVFLRKAIQRQGLPFEVSLDHPSRLTREVMDDVAQGKNLHGPFTSVEALMADLNA